MLGWVGFGRSEMVMGEWLVGQWIVISFPKIFCLCGLKGHIGRKVDGM